MMYEGVFVCNKCRQKNNGDRVCMTKSYEPDLPPKDCPYGRSDSEWRSVLIRTASGWEYTDEIKKSGDGYEVKQ